jgi:hypothetical protein
MITLSLTTDEGVGIMVWQKGKVPKAERGRDQYEVGERETWCWEVA